MKKIGWYIFYGIMALLGMSAFYYSVFTDTGFIASFKEYGVDTYIDLYSENRNFRVAVTGMFYMTISGIYFGYRLFVLVNSDE